MSPTPTRSATNKLATHIMAALLAFLFIALSQPAHAAPPVEAAPPFPVGNLTVYPVIVQPATKPQMAWSITLPAGANAADYTYFIRQAQLGETSSPIYYDIQIPASGEAISALSISPVASRFELWAARNAAPPRTYLLDSTIVGTYLPMASVKIVSEDPYSVLPRTRADRPFSVQVTTTGMLTDPSAPESAKGVTLAHHAQPYGPTGIGDPLDRTQATELSQTSITTNNFIPITYPFASTSIPGENRAKVRGEERFTIFTRADTSLGPNAIDSQLVQIWPVADASITGITEGQTLGSAVPQLTFQLNDLYPSSTTWTQVYKGAPQTGFTGATIPGSTVTLNGSVPENRTIVVDNYGAYVGTDGLWTMELLTKTQFGTDRIAQVSFIVNRANASITGITHGQILGTTFPQLTCQLNGLYQKSATWTQVYQGAPQDGVIGTIIPESVISLNTVGPTNSIITLNNYSSLITTDGVWTMEILTQTSFGTFRLAHVSFIVNRTGTTITDWRQTHFSDPSNTGDGADQNDYDHDGIANLIEFAFGLDPKQPNPGQLPTPEHTADQLAFRFTPPANITGIRYSVESSTTLQPNSWTPVPNTGALPEQLFAIPTTGKPQLYLRLTAEQP